MRKFTVLLVAVCMICLFPVAQKAHSATSPATVSAAFPLASPQSPYQDSSSYQPYTDEQLDNLLAPVALYPDPLLAQVLLATTFPDQIDDAAHYINDNSPNGIDNQNWDVSVKAVAHYPSVLSMLDTMLDWTTALGQAYVYQSTDVMTSVQRLRGLAYSQGNLVSAPQQQVIVDGGYIQIDPAQPQVIYVPVYDPGVIYERRVYSPGVGFGGFFNFGSGFAIGAWLNYDLDWGSHRVVYDGWGGGDTGWRQRSRPYVQINNVYVNNRYVNVNVNRTVVNRHVDYNNVNRFNSVHHDVNYDNRARTQPNNGNNQPGSRGGFQPRQQNNAPQPGNANNGRQSGDQRSFNPGDRNQPPAAGTQPQPYGGRATDRGVRNQPPPATPEQPARNTQQPPQQQQQPNQRPFAYGSRNQQQGPQGTQQNQNGRIVPNQRQPQRQQPTVAAPPQQNNRSFNPGAPNNNQPFSARPQPPARPAPPTPAPPAAPAPAAQPAQHTPSNNAPANNGSKGQQGQGQGQGQGQRGGGHDGGKNNDKNDNKN